MTQPTSQEVKQQIADELTFKSYVYQRVNFPDIAPERWAAIYGAELQQQMEDRYLVTFVAFLIQAVHEEEGMTFDA